MGSCNKCFFIGRLTAYGYAFKVDEIEFLARKQKSAGAGSEQDEE